MLLSTIDKKCQGSQWDGIFKEFPRFLMYKYRNYQSGLKGQKYYLHITQISSFNMNLSSFPKKTINDMIKKIPVLIQTGFHYVDHQLRWNIVLFLNRFQFKTWI